MMNKDRKNTTIYKTLSVFLILSILHLFTPTNPLLASTPTFTNNGAPEANFLLDSLNNLIFDLTLPAPDTDIFLDGDGTDSTGAGTAAAITAGDVLKTLAMAADTALCGNTDGTTAPTNIVFNSTSSDCAEKNSITSPDTGGNVGQHTSMTLDSSGFPVVSYYDFTNRDLKILHCGDANCSSGNSITSPDTTGDVGRYTSITLDSSGFPVVSYFDTDNLKLKILHCGDANCSSGNSITSPDTAGAVGSWTSLTLDASGFPVVSYYDLINGNLKILHCGDANCSSGNSITSPDTTGTVGSHTSITLDASGFPVVSYYDDTNGDLKILHCGDANCSSGNTITSPDSDFDVGEYTSIILDSSGFPVVSYFTSTDQVIKILHCGDANCSSGNSIVFPDITGNVGEYTSIVLDSSGFPVVSYYDDTNGDLKILHCGDANCSSGNSITSPDTAGVVGLNTSIVLDSSGFPVVSYYNNTNGDLKIIHCGDANCSTDTRTVVLGSDTNASSTLVSASSLITFVDDNEDDDWDSGEDLYFDADDSNLYNADTLDALTAENTGTAVDSTDISTIKLWQDDGDGTFSSTSDTSLDSECSFNATTSNWECDTSTQFTSAMRVFLTADISSSATVGSTLTFQVPTLSDDNSNGSFDTGDEGIYFASDHDGPSSNLTNPNTQTIVAPEEEPEEETTTTTSSSSGSSASGQVFNLTSTGNFSQALKLINQNPHLYTKEDRQEVIDKWVISLQKEVITLLKELILKIQQGS